MPRLAKRVVMSGLISVDDKKGGALLGVKIEPVSGGVVEARFTHGEQDARKVLGREVETCPLPCPIAGRGIHGLNRINNSVKDSKRPHSGP